MNFKVISKFFSARGTASSSHFIGVYGTLLNFHNICMKIRCYSFSYPEPFLRSVRAYDEGLWRNPKPEASVIGYKNYYISHIGCNQYSFYIVNIQFDICQNN